MTKQPNFKWDNWQWDFLKHKGSATIRAGRQVGKSTTVGRKCADNMIEYPSSVSLIIAPAQRQSGQLFLKVSGWIETKHQELLEKAGGYKPNPKLSIKANMEQKRRFEYDHGIYNELPTQTTIALKKDFYKPQSKSNKGSICYALPAGKTGVYLRTYALEFLYVDEAAYVPESVYNAIKPMLAVSEKLRGLGWEYFLSTPFGKGGFFYNSHLSNDYRQWHISSEDCPRISKSFLKKEKDRMTKAEYRQEWMGEFSDEWNQYFKSALIKEQMTFIDWNKKKDYNPQARYYLGVDFARLGGDEIALVVCELIKTNLKIVKTSVLDVTEVKNPTTHTLGVIYKYNKLWNFSKIFVDDGGLGAPILDLLKSQIGRKVVGLNNASRRFEEQGEEKKKGILKEDLYSNTLMLLETGKLEMISNMKLLKSLKSITYEYNQDNKRIKIFGDYSHLTEALVRACWCIKERGLGIYLY